VELILKHELVYEHVTKLVERNHEYYVTILWNQRVKTDRTMR